jgi:hypothetical protein
MNGQCKEIADAWKQRKAAYVTAVGRGTEQETYIADECPF